jgi:hypothetical protein
MTRTVSHRIVRFIDSKWFFVGTLIALAVQAVWLAITQRYPLPFDESYHFGIIQVYGQQWSPILTRQPGNPGAYGELIHDPSYLYHYLMSFPYRIIDFLFHNIVIDIGSLRFFSIAFFILGLVGFRKLLFRFGLSRTLTHSLIFIIMLIPVSSLLASQVNYDNLLFCVTPIFLWFTFDVIDDIKKRGRLTYKNTLIMLSLGLLTCLIKYAFLPIFAIVVIYLLVIWLKDKRRIKILSGLKTSFIKSTRKAQVSLAVLFVVSCGLFLQRYGYNAVVYHAVQPDCAQVLTVKQCLQYGPWARNYKLDQTAKSTHSNLSAPARNPLVYVRGWTHAMIFRLYFSIDQDFNEYTPMPLPFVAAFIFGFVGLALTIIYFLRISRTYIYTWLFVVISIAYCVSLLSLNYQEYLRYGTVVAVNGRYLFPILPLLFALFALGYRELVRDVGGKHKTLIKVIIVIIIAVLSIDGGGFIGYLIHSTPKWYLLGDPLTGTSLWIGNALSQVVLGGINQPIDHMINHLLQ